MNNFENKIYDADGVDYLLETTTDPVIKQLCERYTTTAAKLNNDNYSTVMKACTNYINIINDILSNERLVEYI